MKVAIIGTRGIPNNYGGFEQFAEYLSVGLVHKGHSVTVYNSHRHIYQEKEWNGVQIIHKKDPEDKIGTAGQFLYDLNCILDSRKKNFDIILNLGYTSSSIWSKLFPKNAVIITNMDGLEWKRTKFNKTVQKFLLFAEKLAVKNSNYLISDSKAIQEYLYTKYSAESKFIAYGASIFDKADPAVLKSYNLKEYGYNLLIARMEPENHIETILDGIHLSTTEENIYVIGNPSNKFGLYLQEKFKSEKRIIFLGAIYDLNVLNNLRYFSKYYFHGHSVGGTNPSLLEAMACKSLIAAHQNPFNESVLGSDALYFSDSDDIRSIVEDNTGSKNRLLYTDNNRRKIQDNYSWNYIINEYEEFMLNTL